VTTLALVSIVQGELPALKLTVVEADDGGQLAPPPEFQFELLLQFAFTEGLFPDWLPRQRRRARLAPGRASSNA